MTRNFYAIDHANPEKLEYFSQRITAFKSKAVRDKFVEGGNIRFSKTAREATALCRSRFDCTAQEAVMRGFI